jgi:hypothetical protein
MTRSKAAKQLHLTNENKDDEESQRQEPAKIKTRRFLLGTPFANPATYMYYRLSRAGSGGVCVFMYYCLLGPAPEDVCVFMYYWVSRAATGGVCVFR